MSGMKNLLEKMDAMAAAERKPTGPKWPGYWRGKDSAKKSRSRMVGDGGAAESVGESENFLKELDQVINENPVKRDLFQEWHEYKLAEDAKWNPVKKRFEPADEPFDHDAKVRELVKGLENPRPHSPEFKQSEPSQPQDVMIPGQDKGPWMPSMDHLIKPPISEYGAPGSGIGNDTATNPAEVFAKGQERKNARDQAKGQISGLVAQMQGARAQLADLNKQFPQGANPVEKAMSMQQASAQKIGIKKQIEDLSSQIAALRQQAV